MASKPTREEIIDAINREAWIEGMPDQYWQVDGKVYLSKEEMPEDVMKSFEETDQLTDDYNNQNSKYFVNGIEYNDVNDIPKKYRQKVIQHEYENPNKEKYRITLPRFGPLRIGWKEAIIFYILVFSVLYVVV